MGWQGWDESSAYDHHHASRLITELIYFLNPQTETMLDKDRDWYQQKGASVEALENLRRVCKVEHPVSLIELLTYSNGGEGPLPVDPYNFCLDSAETIAESLTAGTFQEFFPGYFVFGSSGGGEIFALDTNAGSGMPVVTLDSTNADLSESRREIAGGFEAFLLLVGKEEE